MKNLLLLIIIPLLNLGQVSTITCDVDCSGEVNSEDASLILQFITNVIEELPCQYNMTGLTPEQLQEIINMMDDQLNITQVGGGNSYPKMISSISNETMYLSEAFIYCAELEEGGYTDWFLPNYDQLAYSISGGCEYPDARTENHLWTSQKDPGSVGNYAVIIRESGNDNSTLSYSYGQEKCRCVRFGEGEAISNLESPFNSSGGGSSISGNFEQPISMIGPMYIAEDFPEFNHLNDDQSNGSYTYGGWSLHYHHAIRFCGELNYNGFSDWFLPSINQILYYLANNNSNYLGISNLSNLAADNYSVEFWSITDSGDSDSGASPNYKSTFFIFNNNATMTNWDGTVTSVANQLNFIDSQPISARRFCFCVR